MARQKIFLKVYLGFWAAIVLVLATLFALDWLTQTGPHFGFPRHVLEDVLTLYGRAALACRRAGDAAAAGELAQHFALRPGLTVYLLDEGGAELSGREPPPELKALAERARASGRQEEERRSERAALALPLDGGEDGLYVAVGELAHGPGKPPEGEDWVFAFKLGVILLVTGAICHFFARYLTTPLLRLREATRRFTLGDFSARVGQATGGRRDEIGEVAAEFDRMAEHLESLVTTQRQLMGDISHELRSPLARLNVALELARRQAGPTASQALDRIGGESQVLGELIAQILTLNRLEAGLARARPRSFDLALLVRQVAEDASFEAQGHGRAVRVAECAPCRISGDGELMRRAVENVVRNAVRYTGLGTEVAIRLRCAQIGSAALAEISVRDHGPGAPEDDLPYLFRPFFRVSHARERQTGGSGLGLAITERAVRAHHGTVWAANAQGGGLRVIILLPLMNAEAGPEQA